MYSRQPAINQMGDRQSLIVFSYIKIKQFFFNVKSLLILLVISPFFFSCNNVENNDTINEKQEPNFIFVLADDQGWNGTSVKMMNNEPMSKSDYYETPNLEILAKKGMRFSNAYASAPVCAPSRYSLQFGQTPARLSLIRVGMNSDHINHQGMLSIPKALKKLNKNYLAAHFGKWGMGSEPEVFGYDFSDGPTQNKAGGFLDNKEQWSYTIKEDPKKIFSVTNRAIEFVEKAVDGNHPFYLQISHYAVHSSFEMQQSSLEKYQLKNKGKYQKDPGLAAMTQDLDAGLGVLLNKIKELGIEKNTYIIYMADNGSVPNVPGAKKYTHSYNHPLSRGKWDAMEGGVRVPLIIAGPGIDPGAESSTPVSGSDLLPTISELAGEKNFNCDSIDGGSIRNILFDKNNKVKRKVDGIFFHVPYKNGIALKRPHSAVRKGDYKLIKFQDNGQTLLFNLINDKQENKNLVIDHPQIARNMEKLLDEYLKAVHAPKWQPGITWKKTPLKEINSTY